MNQVDQYKLRLADFIQETYDIVVVSITSAKRGYYGETWCLDAGNAKYFIKLDYSIEHQIKYQNSLKVVEYICKNDIDFIGNIIKTRAGNLFSTFNSGTLGVFAWIDGKNIETDETKTLEYNMLARLYPLTKQGFDIPSMKFSDEKSVSLFTKWEKLASKPSTEEEGSILAIFEQHQGSLNHYAKRLTYLAKVCQNYKPPYYITHGDAGGNLIVANDKHYIIDWDEVMYASLERDAWVMCCHDWALNAFHDALEQNNILYRLNPRILAFYCYHMFFLYLDELLNDSTICNKTQEIKNYFSCWIIDRMEYADSIF